VKQAGSVRHQRLGALNLLPLTDDWEEACKCKCDMGWETGGEARFRDRVGSMLKFVVDFEMIYLELKSVDM
jgi:hypothetical protein